MLFNLLVYSTYVQQASSLGNGEEKELLQVTVRHATKGHVTLPVSYCRFFAGFNEVTTKHRYFQYGEYDSELCRLEDILWPPERPLPFPIWGAIKTRLHIASANHFDGLILALTSCVRSQLKTHSYNTVGNFLT